MRYIDEFRNLKLIRNLSVKIKDIAPLEKSNIMEVCGTHTQAFHRFGLKKFLPEKIRFIAGPGCPVCVSKESYIDHAISLAKESGTIILTFGDMLAVPGRNSSLEKQRAEGADVRVVYSCWDSLSIAQDNPSQKVIFLAVGFETTAPTVALTILAARARKINNLFFFSSLKLIPPAMESLLKEKDLKIDGFLCPGHVSVIIGIEAYEFISKKYGIGCCIAGFEPMDILEGIYLLLRQIQNQKPRIENQYIRAVRRAGNRKAREAINKVFEISDADWRGLGRIPASGLAIKEEFQNLDAEKVFKIKDKQCTITAKEKKCRCADVLKGLILPLECPLFSQSCSPVHPLGPCMVSKEGACNAYYRYR